MKTDIVRCTMCGNDLHIDIEQTTGVCDACGSSFVVSQALEFLQLDKQQTEGIEKLRENIKRSVRIHEYDSVLVYVQQLLQILPKDITGLYYEAFSKSVLSNPNFLYDFLDQTKLEYSKDEMNQIVEHLIHFSELRDFKKVAMFIQYHSPEHTTEYYRTFEERTRLEDMYAPVPRDVFICHRSLDKEIVKQVVEELENDGNTCFVSYRNLRPNDNENYWKNITDAIEQCSLFLVVSSRDAMLSKDVQKELMIAKKMNKKRLELKVDESVHSSLFKHFFDGVKWIDASTDLYTGLNELKERVMNVLFMEDTVSIDSSQQEDTTTRTTMTNTLSNREQRILIDLEHGKFSECHNAANKLLDENVNHPIAWYVLFMVKYKYKTMEQLLHDIETNKSIQMIQEMVNSNEFDMLKKTYIKYDSFIKRFNHVIEQKKEELVHKPLFTKSEKYELFDLLQKIHLGEQDQWYVFFIEQQLLGFTYLNDLMMKSSNLAKIEHILELIHQLKPSLKQTKEYQKYETQYRMMKQKHLEVQNEYVQKRTKLEQDNIDSVLSMMNTMQFKEAKRRLAQLEYECISKDYIGLIQFCIRKQIKRFDEIAIHISDEITFNKDMQFILSDVFCTMINAAPLFERKQEVLDQLEIKKQKYDSLLSQINITSYKTTFTLITLGFYLLFLFFSLFLTYGIKDSFYSLDGVEFSAITFIVLCLLGVALVYIKIIKKVYKLPYPFHIGDGKLYISGVLGLLVISVIGVYVDAIIPFLALMMLLFFCIKMIINHFLYFGKRSSLYYGYLLFYLLFMVMFYIST